jgi:hypothetical protein
MSAGFAPESNLGQHQPIDRAIATNQRCRLAVADQGIVFDSSRRRSQIVERCYSHRITKNFVVPLVKWKTAAGGMLDEFPLEIDRHRSFND